jgi:uncharacterized membrane protein YfcA
MKKYFYYLIVICFGSLSAFGTIYWVSHTTGKIFEPFYIVFAISWFIGSLVSQNIHQSNDFVAFLSMTIIYSIIIFLIMHLIDKKFMRNITVCLNKTKDHFKK